METDSGLLAVLRKTVELMDAGRPLAVALVLKTKGSTPRKEGVRAIVEASGRIWGTLGGGVVERKAQLLASQVCASGLPALLNVRLDADRVDGEMALCGGWVRLLLHRPGRGERECYDRAARALESRRKGVLLTTALAVGSRAALEVSVRWLAGGALPEGAGLSAADSIRASLASGSPCSFEEEVDAVVEGRRREILVEPVCPAPSLVIAGGGHVGQALARQASRLGFDVTVLDDRPEYAAKALFPEGVATRCGGVAKNLALLARGEDVYIVIVTRGHRGDAQCLEACIRSPARYIGMIGSKRKVALMREHFMKQGLATEKEWARVCAPIGLDIGAVTVPEIATSIAAQLVAVRRRGRPVS